MTREPIITKMEEPDVEAGRAPRYNRRLSDKIVIAFHHACDQADFEVAEQLLHILEMMLTRRHPTLDGTRRRDMETLIAAHERLWHLQHPSADEPDAESSESTEPPSDENRNERLESLLIPIRVYLSDGSEEDFEATQIAIKELIDSSGFDSVIEYPAIRGSWYKEFKIFAADFFHRKEVSDQIAKLEHAIELKALSQPQAEVDDKQAAAAAKLIKAVERTTSAAMQVGSILVIKCPSKNGSSIYVRTLSHAEMICIDRDPTILRSPEAILQILAKIASSTQTFPMSKKEKHSGPLQPRKEAASHPEDGPT